MSNKTEYTVILQYNFIAEQLTRYAGIMLYTLCFIGTVMNMLTFRRRTYKNRPCSLYLMVASMFDFIHLNFGPLSNILQYGFDYDWTITSIAYCKIKSYTTFVFAVMSATLTTFACIDRYMLSSRDNRKWKYCTHSIAQRTIQLTILFWFVISIPIIYCYTRIGHVSNNEQLMCTNSLNGISCSLIQVIYMCIFNGFLHPIAMMVFGILTCANIHNLRRRSLFKSFRIEQMNYQLTSMLVLQSIKSSFSSFPFAIFTCYLLITRHIRKSPLYQAKENLINQIFYLLFWSNYTSFFVYIYSSDIFRIQWIKAMKRIIYGKQKRRLSCRTEINRLTCS